MANKRMINKTVIDSDVFLDMPQTTQNLYFHLNMRADDDGFLDNPKKIMRTIGANQNDLEILLAKRYLLAFNKGVIVIKHWKLHNTIRKDRYKPTLYQEQLKTLIEKDNGVYTEAYKQLEQKELDEWQPDGNQMATKRQPRLDKIRLDPDKKEKKIKKEFSYSSKAQVSKTIDLSIKLWNSLDGLAETRRLTATLGEKARPIVESVKLYNPNEVKQAIYNYHKIITNPDKYKHRGEYGDVFGFLTNGLEKYCDDSKPLELMKIAKPGGEEKRAEVTEYQYEYCSKCGTKMIHGSCPECDVMSEDEAREALTDVPWRNEDD